MKLEFAEGMLSIYLEDARDVAYIREELGLRKHGDATIIAYVHLFSEEPGVLRILSRELLDDETKQAIQMKE